MSWNILKLSWIDLEENLSASEKPTGKPVSVSEKERAISLSIREKGLL